MTIFLYPSREWDRFVYAFQFFLTTQPKWGTNGSQHETDSTINIQQFLKYSLYNCCHKPGVEETKEV